MVMKVAVIEKDPRFLDRLTAVFSKNYGDKVELYPFTDPDVAISTLQFVKPHILIAEESIRLPSHALPAGCALAYFVSAVGTDQIDGHRAICKFQRAELIYKQLLGILSEEADSAPTHGAETALLTFTSPVGGVGVSTAAAAFALRLASRGHRVLYLDLDAYSCPRLYFHGEGNYTLADVLHTLVHKDGNLTELLVHATRKDPRGVSYFCEGPADSVYPSLTPEDIARLLRELRIIAAFDYMVIDIPFFTLLEQKDLLERSRGVVLLADGTEGSQQKLVRGYYALLHEIEAAQLQPELFLLHNKCNTFPIGDPRLSALVDLGQIPFVPGKDISGLLASVAELPVLDPLTKRKTEV